MNELLTRDRENIWHPFTPLLGAEEPILVTSAHGIYLHTHDGRKIIDAISSWWVNLHGHSNPIIAEAIAKQAANLEHVIFAGFTHEPAIELSDNLLRILPKGQSKIFFSDNGSTAVEVALKLGFQYWHNLDQPRKKVVAFLGAYHGDTFGSMAVGDRGLFTKPFFPFLFDVEFIPLPSPKNESEVLDNFKSIVAQGDVASFIFEPLVQAAGGMRMYSPVLLDKLIEVAKENEVVCIADEVFTGFGRTGKLFASHYLKNFPDIMALSKGLTGGTLPLGATSCSKKIASAFTSDDFSKTFFHGHSYTGNPLSCSAANASFKLLNNSSCVESIDRIGKQHKTFSSQLANHSKVKDARSLGTILAIELAAGKTSYDNTIRKSIYSFFLERDILVRPLGNVIYILPPYIITDAELEIIYDALAEFLEQI
jgi:adenosylmethionine-8-amino-7-oxononanoate aminotransferase